jgi:hypothetical protein
MLVQRLPDSRLMDRDVIVHQDIAKPSHPVQTSPHVPVQHPGLDQCWNDADHRGSTTTGPSPAELHHCI